MANINTELEQIRKAVYGREVRGSIANAIELINKEQINTSTAQTNLASKFNQLIINAGNSNAEVVAARVKADGTQFNTLGERLDKSDEQLDNNTKYRNTIALTLDEVEGKSDLEKLQKAHDALVLKGGGTLVLPPRELTIDDTFTWNISRVNINGNRTKIKCILNDLNKYAVKLTSESLLEYAPSQNNKLIASSGIEFDGVNRNCKGIDFDFKVNSQNTISNITFRNMLIRRFDVGLDFGDNTYMIDFENCVISFNRINIQQRTPKVNAGERISFTGCDITGTQGIADSIAINNLDFTTFQFINCSLDWHRRLFYNKGQLIFDSCHIESPEYALDNPEQTGNYYGECGKMGHVYFTGGRILLNHNPVKLQIKALFNLSDFNSSVTFSNMLFQVYNVDFIGVGNGYVGFNDNVKFPRNGLSNINFYISNNDRSNCFLDSDFSFSNHSQQDDYTISSGIKHIKTINGKKCLEIENNQNVNEIVVTMKVPVKSINNFLKFGIEYYMPGKPKSLEIRGYTVNDRSVYRFINKVDNFNESNNSWASVNVNFQTCATPVNLDLVAYVEIKLTVDKLTGVDKFYLTNPRFTSF